MARIKWDKAGDRFYETGVENGVLYVAGTNGTYGTGVAWNGLISVTESPSGAEATPIYADNIKYVNLVSNEEFGATIEAYTYPDEFAECDGSVEIVPGVFAGQQARKTFGMAYKTIVGNDEELNEHGYKIHLIYGCLAAPSEKAYSTVNDSPEAATFSWTITTTPVAITTKINNKTLRPTSCLTFDSRKFSSTFMTQLQDLVFGKDPTETGGSDGTDPTLPNPDRIIELFHTT